MSDSPVTIRRNVRPDDSASIRRIVAATGFFRDDEIDVAVELVDDRLAKGTASDYHFIIAEIDGETAGYACYGPIACTRWSYDLYWIAVDPGHQRHGLGRQLVAESEHQIAQAGGRRVYVETSGRQEYLPTQAFYERCGYRVEAQLAEFYGPDDAKLVYVKVLP